MIRGWLWRFFLWYFWWPRGGPGSSQTVCGPRVERRARAGRFELTLIERDTSLPDVYSREEVYVMLRTVREQEWRMSWRCPEPPPMEPLIEIVDGAGRPRLERGLPVRFQVSERELAQQALYHLNQMGDGGPWRLVTRGLDVR